VTQCYHVGFGSSRQLSYLDYDDPDRQMAEYFEAGFPAWMRAYRAGELVVRLLLKND
jgi:hypothetical protein